MSNVVDQRTVEMRFDNKDFERNVETSLGTIEKLKSSLNFKDTVVGLTDFYKSLQNFKTGDSFEKTKISVDDLGHSLSDLFKNSKKIWAVREINRGLDSLRNKIVSVTKSVTGLEMAQAGLDKYWNKTSAVQTIMAATGKSVDEVSMYLEKLNWYSDETSASFTDMTNNIGKFTSAGVKLEDAVSAMEGVFNWASTSGRGVAEAGRAMYNLSQAIGIGSVKLMDWRSIQNANMDTVEFKQTVLDTGVALGKLTKQGDEYYSTVGKKTKITNKNFADTLNTGWFDSELLVATLKRYSEFTEKVYAYMEDHEEYDTAQEAMEAMRLEAKETGEEFDELGYKWFISAQEAKSFADVVESIKDAVSTGWMQTFEYIFGNYEQARRLWTDLANELYDLFAVGGNNRNDLLFEVMTSSYQKLKKEIIAAGLSVDEFDESLTKVMSTTEESKNELSELIKEYGSIGNALDAGAVNKSWITQAIDLLKHGGEEGKKVSATFEEVEQIVKDTWNTNKYGVGSERVSKYEELGYEAKALQKLVDIYGKVGKITPEDLLSVGIEESKEATTSWGQFIDENGELIDSLDQLSGRQLLLMSFWNVFKGITGTIQNVKSVISSIFKITPEGLRNALEGLYNVTNFFNKIITDFEESPYVKKALTIVSDSISEFVENTKSEFKAIKNTVLNIFDKTYIGGRIKSYINQWKASWAEFGDVANIFDRLAKTWKSFKEKWLESHGEDWDLFSAIFDGIKKDFEKFKEKLSSFNIFDKISSLFKKEGKKGAPKSSNQSLVKALDLDQIERDFKVASFIRDALKGIFANPKLVFEAIKNNFGTLFDGFDLIGDGIKAAANTFKENFKNGVNIFKNVGSSVKEFFFTFAESLTAGLFDRNQKNSFANARKLFLSNFSNNWLRFKDSILQTYDKIFKTSGAHKTRISKISEFLDKYINLENTRNVLKEKFTALKESLFSNWFKFDEAVDDAFNGKNSKIVKDSNKASYYQFLFKQLKDTILPYLNEAKAVLKSFWNWSKPLLKTIAETFAKDLNFSSLSGLLTSIATLNLSKVGKNIGDFFDELTKKTKRFSIADEITDACKGIAEAFTPLKEVKGELKTRSFLEIAIGIGIVAGALYALSKVDKEDLIKAGIAVGIIATVLTGIAIAINSMKTTSIEFSLSNTGTIIKAVLLLLAISSVIKNVGKAAKSIAESVDILITAVEKLSDLASEKVRFQKGLEAVQDLMLSLGASVGLAGLGAANVFGGTALSILAMAGAIRILFKSVVQFSELSLVSPDEMEKAIDQIRELMLSLGAAVAISGLTGGIGLGSIGRAVTIMSFVAAIKALQNSVIELAKIPDASKLESAVDAISKMITSLGSASFWSGITGGLFGGLGRGLTIFAFGKTVSMLVSSIESIVDLSVNQARFEQASNTIIEIMNTLTRMSVFLGVLNAVGAGVSLANAASIVAIGLSIRFIADSLISLTALNKERLEQSGNAIGQIAVLLAGFTFVLGILNSKPFNGSIDIEGIGAAAMIIAFANAIKTIANTMIMLGDVDSAKLEKGKNAVISISAIIAAFTVISSISKGLGKSKIFGLNIVGLAAGLYIFGIAIQKLGDLDENTMWRGVLAVSVLTVAIGASIMLMNVGKNVPSWTNAANIAALAAGILVLSEVAKTFADMDANQLKKSAGAIVALLVAIGLITKIALPKAGTLENVFGSLSLLVIAGTVALLAEIAKSFKDMEVPQLAKIGGAMLGMIVAMKAIASFVQVGSKISLLSIGKLGLVIAAIGGVLFALGGLFQIDIVSRWMEKGGDFLAKIGEAIGKFIGGITSGTSEGVRKLLGAIGAGLGDFATNAKPFFDVMKNISGMDLAAIILSLAGALVISEWSEFIFKIGQFANVFSNSKDPSFASMKAFGQGLTDLAPGLEAISNALQGGTGNLPSVLSSLSELSRINRQQSKVEGNPLQDFAVSIKTASSDIKEAIESFNGIPALNEKGKEAITALTDIASIKLPDIFKVGANGSITGEGAFIELWGGISQTFSQFAIDLKTSASSFQTFIEAVNDFPEIEKYEDGASKIETLTTIINSLAEIDLHASGGFIGKVWSNYDNAFTNLANDIKLATPSLRDFIVAVNAFGTDVDVNDIPDMDKINQVIGIIGEMAKIVPNDVSGNVWRSHTDMVNDFKGAVEALNTLSESINVKTLSAITTLLEYLDASNQKKTSSAYLDQIPGKLEKFQKDLSGITFDENLVAGLSAIATILSPIEGLKEAGFIEVATDISSGVRNLGLVEDAEIARARNTVTWYSEFIRKIFKAQNEYNGDIFGSQIESMMQKINSGILLLNQPTKSLLSITRLFEAIQSIYNLKFTKNDRTGMTTLEEAFSSLSDAIDNFAPKTSTDTLEGYFTWLEELSGKAELFRTISGIINGFTIDTNKMQKLTDFLKVFQGYWTLPSGSQTVDPFGNIVYELDYFQKIADDLIATNAKLEGQDFEEINNASDAIYRFASGLNRLSTLNVDSLRKRLNEIFRAINDGILGDGTEDLPNMTESIQTITDKIAPLTNAFDTLQSYADSGIGDVVPNILSGISSAIDEFEFNPYQLALVEDTLSRIAKSVGLLDPVTGLPIFGSGTGGTKNGLLGSTRSGGKIRISKSDKLIGKIGAYQGIDEFSSLFEGLVSSVDSMDLDPKKAGLLTELVKGIESASESLVEATPESFSGFVEAIAMAIEDNSVYTNDSAKVIVDKILEVFESLEEQFIKVGMIMVHRIAEGMLTNSREVMETAATVAMTAISTFDTTVSDSENSGKKLVDNVIAGISSEESKMAIQNAVNGLFSSDTTNPEGELTETSLGKVMGEKFITDFAEGLQVSGADMFSSLSGTFSEFGESFDLSTLTSSITDKVDIATKELDEPISMLNSTLSGAVPDGAGLGNAMVDGIINALKDRLEEACTEMAVFCSKLSSVASHVLGIHSPSKVFYKIGEYVVEGLENGISNNSSRTSYLMEGLVGQPVEKIQSLIKWLNKGWGDVSFNGKLFNKNDVVYLEKYVKSLKEAERSASNTSDSIDNIKDSTKAGGGGGGGAVSDKEDDKDLGSTVLKGTVYALKAIRNVLSSYENDADKVSFLEHILGVDKPEEIKKKLKDYGEYLNEVLPTELQITPVVSGNGTKGALGSINKATEKPKKVGGYLKKLTNKISEDTSEADSIHELLSRPTSITMNQYNTSPKPLGALQIYRQTRNQFAMMKNYLLSKGGSVP